MTLYEIRGFYFVCDTCGESSQPKETIPDAKVFALEIGWRVNTVVTDSITGYVSWCATCKETR